MTDLEKKRNYHRQWMKKNPKKKKKKKEYREKWEGKHTPEELSAIRKAYRETFLAKNPNYFKEYRREYRKKIKSKKS